MSGWDFLWIFAIPFGVVVLYAHIADKEFVKLRKRIDRLTEDVGGLHAELQQLNDGIRGQRSREDEQKMADEMAGLTKKDRLTE